MMADGMKHRSLLAKRPFSAIVLVLISALLLSLYINDQQSKMNTLIHRLSSTNIFTSSAESEFRALANSYQRVRPGEIPESIIDKYYDKIGPEIMLNIVDENPYCHYAGHSIGRAVLEKTRDFDRAMEICGVHCNQGCFHGALMQMIRNETVDLAQLSSKDAIDLREFSDELCQSAKTSINIDHGTCYHGLGHAFMYWANDSLPLAIPACSIFPEYWDRFTCASGAYMQYYLDFGSDGQPYPCLESPYPAACYRSKFSFANRSLTLLKTQKQSCLQLSGQYQLACLFGLGHGYEGYVLNGKIKMDDLCAGTRDQKHMCIDGVIISMAFYAKEKAIKLCHTMDLAFLEYCLNDTNIFDHWLDRPTKYYVLNESEDRAFE